MPDPKTPDSTSKSQEPTPLFDEATSDSALVGDGARAAPRSLLDDPARPTATEEGARLDRELKEIEVRMATARLRAAEAEAEIKEQEAARLRAETTRLSAEGRAAERSADYEGARQTQALVAGWVAIALIVIVVLLSLIVAYSTGRAWTVLPASLTGGLGIYGFRRVRDLGRSEDR